MNLKTQLLRTLRGGALLGMAAGTLSSCGETEQERGNEKPWKLNSTSYTSSCLEDGQSYTEYPYEGWQSNAEVRGGPGPQRVIICAPQESVACSPGDQLTMEQSREFVTAAFGQNDSCDPYPYVSDDVNTCGPVHNSGSECCYAMTISFSFCVEGRPFTVDGLARLASVTERTGWCEAFSIKDLDELPRALRDEIACAWAEAGTHEHASVASFSKFIMELMALGAPMHLVHAASVAMADEIRHARDCFSIASAYAGKTLGPDVVDVQGSLSHVTREADILRAAIFEACIGETLAASVAQWMAPRARDEGVRGVFAQIAAEEGDHAQLGWEFVQWMLHTRPHLRDVARACFEHAFESPRSPWATGLTDEDRVLLEHGRIRPALEDHLRRRAFHHIVIPCVDALFASLEAPQDADTSRATT